MELVESLIEEGEEIWWEGQPDKHALTEQYYEFSIFSIIILILSGFIGMLIMVASFRFDIFSGIIWGFILFIPGGSVGLYMFYDGFKNRHYKGVFYLITSRRIIMINEGKKRKTTGKLYFFRDVLLIRAIYPLIDKGIAQVPTRKVRNVTIVPGRRGYNVYFVLYTMEWGHWFKFEQISDIKTCLEIITNKLKFDFKKIDGKAEIYRR